MSIHVERDGRVGPDQPDLYQQNDPDQTPAESPPPEGSEPAKRGRKPATGEAPSPRAAEMRAKRAEQRAARQAATKTAPEVATEKGQQTPAEQVVRTLSNLTEDQRRTREFTLGLLAHGWSQGTSRLLGVALARPEEKKGAAEFDELVSARPDIGAAANAFQGWITAFDAVAIKRDWYREMPAEWMLGVSTLMLAGAVGMVVLANVKLQKDGAARARANEAEAAQLAERQAAERAQADAVAAAQVGE